MSSYIYSILLIERFKKCLNEDETKKGKQD